MEPRNSFYSAGRSGGDGTYRVHFVLIFPPGLFPSLVASKLLVGDN